MAQYNGYRSYNIEQFEPRVVTNSNAAPKLKPQPQKRPNLKVVERTKKTAAQLRQEMEESSKRALKAFAVAIAILMFMAFAIYSRVQLDEINRKISSVENSIELAKSDSIKLNNSLSAMVSIDNVEDYAADVLGMVKVQDYQVVYVDLSSADSVVVANGEQTDESPVINENNK